MITGLQLQNFKSFKALDLALGPLNIFLGANATGKSNLFDAFRVMQGVGNGFSLSEILDGKPKGDTSEVWPGIRGGSAMVWRRSGNPPALEDLKIRLSGVANPGAVPWQYGLTLLPNLTAIYHGLIGHAGNRFSVAALESVLTQSARGNPRGWSKEDVALAGQISRLLANTQHLQPSPEVLRQYSRAQQVSRMGDQGEQFAALVRQICQDVVNKAAYLSWLQHLRPEVISDVGVREGLMKDCLFMIQEQHQEFLAPVLSEGTLRFAALVAAFFQPEMPGMLFLEEVENGIHPSRLRLMMELLRTQAAKGQTQIMVSTHSPALLAWVQEAEYAHTFFCQRDEETGESRIRPLTAIPEFKQAIKHRSLAELITEGWLETLP
jgi:predicted ATPase